MRKVFSSGWVKVAIALVVVALLIHFNRVDATVLVNLGYTWPWLLAAFLLMLPSFAVVSLRFKVILRSQGIKVPFSQALRWTMIGAFFDLAMPSSSGGDLVKAGYVVKHVAGEQKMHAVMAVAFDRVVGMLGLFLLAFVASGLGWELLRDLPARNLVVGMTFVASFGALLFFRVAGSRRLHRRLMANRFLANSGWGGRIAKLITSFNLLREQPASLFAALGLSVVNHAFWCLSLFCLVRVVGATVDPVKGFAVFPLAIFSNIFGVAGGFGGGTVGFDLLLLKLLALNNGALIGLLYQSLAAFARLGGMPFYLASPPNHAKGSPLKL